MIQYHQSSDIPVDLEDQTRTTIDIADDVWFAAKDLARRDHKTVGQVISDLVRRALTAPAHMTGGVALTTSERLAPYGITPLPQRGGIVTDALIDRLRNEQGI